MSGKGSAPRPLSVSNEEYANRWDSIFSKKEEHSVSANSKGEQLELPLSDECRHPVWGYSFETETYFCVDCGLGAKHPSEYSRSNIG